VIRVPHPPFLMRSRSLVFLVPVLVLAGAVAAGCGGSSSPKAVPSDGVALVGDQTITKEQYNQLLNQARSSFKSQNRPFPKQGSEEFKALQDQAIQYLVQRAEFQQKGDDLDVNVSDKQVGKRLKEIKKQYFGGSEKRYKQQLKRQGLTEEQVRDDVRAQLLSEAIFKKVTADVKVTDADVRKYYNEHKSQYEQPATRDVRHILVNNKALADKLYAQLKNGGDFAALAKKYSKDPGSAAQGGKLTISKGQTVPEFDKAAFSLKKNELSKPIKTQYGWHIIQPLSGVRESKQTPFAQVKESIKQQLQQEKRNKAMTDWVDETKKDFCDGQLSYQEGYKPKTDPCIALTTSTATTTAATETS
jgi:parvulin-like peptidyl-prolyl isomerase